jgi:16S rRNA (guanine966-N2)-methyltransferase
VAGSRIRITGGILRGVPIIEPRGYRLRPTSARLREAIFNILGATVEGARVLDLYAGTGAFGLEALSRGASHATFIDQSHASIAAIEKSLAAMHLEAAGTTIRGALPAALSRVETAAAIIFIDAPYDDPNAIETVSACAPYLLPGGTVVYEHASRYNPPERPPGLILGQRRVYGDSAISLYVPQEGE